MDSMNIVTTQTIACPHCGGIEGIDKFGSYKGQPRYWCKACKRKFKADGSLPHKKMPANLVSATLNMWYEGMSQSAIRRHLQQEYGHSPSTATIYEWIDEYTQSAIAQSRDYKPKVGDVWVADETVLKIDGQNVWFWDIIDKDTRFLLASHVSLTRTTGDARLFLIKAHKRAGKAPKTIITDKLAAYLDGVEITFKGKTEHRQSKPFTIAEDSTNQIERFHGTLKQRTKVMRGLKNIDTAIQFTDGWLVHYNFLRPHESLNEATPAQAAGIDYPFKNWADITRTSSPVTYSREQSPRTKMKLPKPRKFRMPKIPNNPRLGRIHRTRNGVGISRRMDR